MAMNRARRAAIALALVVIAPLAAAQAPTAVGGPVWPAPPAPARIRFLQSLNPTTMRGRPSVMARVWRVIVGGGETPRMLQPYGIAVGPDGRVYVADTYGGAIHVYDVHKHGYATIRVDGQSLIGLGLARDRIFVTDSAAGRLLCLDAKGKKIWTLGPKDGFERPAGLVVAGDRLYVVDTVRHLVVAVSLAGEVVGGFGSPGAGPGQFNFPTNIARGNDGRLYVTDTMNFRVQIFSPEGQYLNAFGQLGDGSGDFDKPKGVAVDSGGHVYVVEGFNDVVQIFDETGRLLLAFGGSGTGDGQFWLPSGIAIANDVIYVADSANRRVEMFSYLKDAR